MKITEVKNPVNVISSIDTNELKKEEEKNRKKKSYFFSYKWNK